MKGRGLLGPIRWAHRRRVHELVPRSLACFGDIIDGLAAVGWWLETSEFVVIVRAPPRVHRAPWPGVSALQLPGIQDDDGMKTISFPKSFVQSN